MGYACKLGGSSSSSLEVINCGTYSATGTKTIDLSNYTSKYADLKVNENIFFGNIIKQWITSGGNFGRNTQSLNPIYNSPILTIYQAYSYTGSGYGDYIIYTVFIVI